MFGHVDTTCAPWQSREAIKPSASIYDSARSNNPYNATIIVITHVSNYV